jgi:hypothetical protein
MIYLLFQKMTAKNSGVKHALLREISAWVTYRKVFPGAHK